MTKKQEDFEKVLHSSYNHDDFISFVKEFLNGTQIIAPYEEKKDIGTFFYYVRSYYHIGNYVTDDKDKILVLSVNLQQTSTVERGRSMQRNFVKRLMENAGASGAIVSFYTAEEPEKWRLSFIRMDYEFSKGKVSEKLTPAKRYSFLVGKDEPCTTALQRLYPIFSDEQQRPDIDAIEDAFSVEKVTKRFFDQYAEKYHEVREYLESNEDFMIEARTRGFTAEQFTKKLLGQIVFLYFIQKKGWLGVKAIPMRLDEKSYNNAFFAKGAKSREILPKVYQKQDDGSYRINVPALQALSDADESILALSVKGEPWGSGPKDFMRQMFDGCIKAGKNYFDDYLEPLFYTGLNLNRGENGFYPPLHRRIPFLNGGLFEQIDNYDWENNDFCIPNNLFSNKDEKGRDADGILDIFDSYNFTMSEDEPMEREVAIDPEMLGKVFENLLDVKDRKSKGAFYTPREIVHYMCQETLINYLSGKSGISEEAIRDFILLGDFFKDEDTEKTKKIQDNNGKTRYVVDKDKDLYISEEIFSFKKGVDRLKELDELLKNVKVADLAVGSGAFPLGMLNEIVRARETLTAYMSIDMNAFEKKSFIAYGRSYYDLKVSTIKNCIFACDIEPSAVDIAKLRLWLSIVIDDEITEDNANGAFGAHSKPRQLPNLECNIICGNSLIDEFKGISLITKSDVLNNTDGTDYQYNVFHQGVDPLISKLIELQDKMFFVKEHNEKEEIRQQIQNIYNQIILEQIGGDNQMMEAYYDSLKSASSPFILWQLYFPRVFRDNGGFDVVIGNPPYVQLQKTINDETGEKLGDAYEHLEFETFTKTGDLYCLFYEKGFKLLRENGVLAFITSNKWMRAGYGEKLRDFFSKRTNPLCLIDFAGQKIFESATVDVNILLFSKSRNKGNTTSCVIRDSSIGNLSVYIMQSGSQVQFSSSNAWVIMSPIEQSIKEKISSKGIPLANWDIEIYRGVLTGYNSAFIINTQTKDSIITSDPKSAELIRPILRGRDIQRYGYYFADLWLINVHNGIKEDNIPPINIDDYPAIKQHLDTYYPKLLRRADKGITPYNLRNCAYMNDFSKQKIIWKRIGSKLRFSFDENGLFCLDSTCFATGTSIPYLVSVLNTCMGNYLLKDSPKTGTGDLIISVQALEPARIPLLNESEQKPYKELLYTILDCINNEKDYTPYEKQLESLVFDLYGLNDDERSYVEKTVNELYR